MLPSVARILDANFNRAREALRVLEDFARFHFEDASTSAAIKTLRHDLAAVTQTIDSTLLIANRNTPADVGTSLKAADEFDRPGITSVISANAKRLTEALRTLEETCKLAAPALAAQLETMRYRAYDIEHRLLLPANLAARFAAAQLYVLLTESLCSQPWLEVLKQVLAGGADVVQLREKQLADKELLARAKVARDLCRKAGALLIINDRPDIAMLAGADGVHVGQHNLPVAEVKRLVGNDLIVGLSTSRIEEAKRAVADGAGYIAAGPMFATGTKAKDYIAGPAYAAAAVEYAKAHNIACVAIGGIRAENVGELTAVGVTTVAVCQAVIAAPDPTAACRQIKAALAHAAVPAAISI